MEAMVTIVLACADSPAGCRFGIRAQAPGGGGGIIEGQDCPIRGKSWKRLPLNRQTLSTATLTGNYIKAAANDRRIWGVGIEVFARV